MDVAVRPATRVDDVAIFPDGQIVHLSTRDQERIARGEDVRLRPPPPLAWAYVVYGRDPQIVYKG